MNDYLTVDEIAEVLRVSVSTVRRHISEGHLPVRRVGTRIIISRAALEAAIEAGIPPITHTTLKGDR